VKPKKETISRSALLCLILCLLAFVIRLGTTLALRDWHIGPGAQMGADGIEFNQLGRHLAEGRGYVWDSGQPTAFRAPGFPMFLSLIFRLFGDSSYPIIYVSFALLGALTVLFTFLLGEKLGGERLGLYSGVFAAFYFPHVYFSTVFASENLFTLCLAACLYFYLRGGVWSVVSAGVCLGLATLTRPLAILVLPVLIGLMLWETKKALRPRLTSALILALMTLAVVLPWTLRNYQVFHKVVFVATNGGATFYGGNNDVVLHQRQHLGGWVSSGQLPGRALIDAQPDEVSHDKKELELGLEWSRTHIASLPLLTLYKFVRFCLPESDSGNRKFVLLQWVLATPVLLLAGLGIFRSRGDLRFRTLSLTLLISVVSALIFWGAPRFRDGCVCLLAIYAALGLLSLRRHPK
jgi:4-amino-4-deoxy-L-arabinose transferase-like glycosyltransferase